MSSAAFLSFFRNPYGRSRLPDLRLSRLLRAFIGQQARRLPARPAPDISPAGRDYLGLLEFTPPLIGATHPETRSENEELRTRTGDDMREGQKERERV